MNAKRKRVEDFILTQIKNITHSDNNVKLYTDLFKSMSDDAFDTFMVKLRNKEITLAVIAPNEKSDVKITVENNFKVAKSLGFEFFQNLNIESDGILPSYPTPNKYMILKLPIKRAAQLLSKGISVPEDNKSIDLLSGQVTGKSKSSKLTLPELQILAGLGLKDTIVELMKTRGGDAGEAMALDNLLYKQGSVSQATLRNYSTGVTSTATLDAFFNAAHIKTTLRH
jgi:DNA-directed RNA polymerase subunit K/omega